MAWDLVRLEVPVDRDVDNYEYEERAAIMEYDGGLPRDEAERLARDEIRKGEQEEFDFDR